MTVDREGPGVGVAERELEQHAAKVGTLGNVSAEVASQHDLLEIAGEDARDGRRDGGAEVIRRLRPGVQRQPVLRAERGCRQHVVGTVDARDPADAVAATDDDARHDQYRSAGGGVVERERPEGDEPRTADLHLVGDPRGRGDFTPRIGGIRQPGRAVELEPQGFTDSGDAVAPAQEQQRMAWVGEGNERGDRISPARFDGEVRHTSTLKPVTLSL